MAHVFADTSAWYAVYDKRDRHHDRAATFLKETDNFFVTSNLIFAETLSLITKRLGKSLALSFGQKIRASEKVRILHIDPGLEEKAWKYFEHFHDKPWDFIDCASFALMDSLRLDSAFTFDAHFSQKGFKILP